MRNDKMLEIENKAKADGFRFIFGVDEAGRGPLAGPVVAAAVFLRNTDFCQKIADSKKMTPRQREKAFLEIQERAVIGIGMMSEAVIDDRNILRATHLAMTSAVHDLVSHLPQEERDEKGFVRSVKVLVDGNLFTGRLPYVVNTVVKGDALSLSIACASIVAKVFRDRIMEHYHTLFPLYGFRVHKGYPTQAHRDALKEFGPSPIHRKTFRVS